MCISLSIEIRCTNQLATCSLLIKFDYLASVFLYWTGSLQGSELVEKMQEHENALSNCVTQLENFETTRLALVSQLNEALQDQV